MMTPTEHGDDADTNERNEKVEAMPVEKLVEAEENPCEEITRERAQSHRSEMAKEAQ